MIGFEAPEYIRLLNQSLPPVYLLNAARRTLFDFLKLSTQLVEKVMRWNKNQNCN